MYFMLCVLELIFLTNFPLYPLLSLQKFAESYGILKKKINSELPYKKAKYCSYKTAFIFGTSTTS